MSRRDTDTDQVIGSIRQTAKYLFDKGYKVSRSKLSRDERAGKITKQADGSITARAAWEYAETHLEKTGSNKDDLKDLQAKRLQNAIRNQDLEHKKKTFELAREQGKYVLRTDLEAELAARAVIFDSMFRHLFNTRVRSWIALVTGKAEKAADLLAALNESLDALLNEYASTKTFQVLFEESTDMDEDAETGEGGAA